MLRRQDGCGRVLGFSSGGRNPYAHRTAMAKKRILFIDNRPEHVRQPVLRLQLAGYRVDEAPSGEAGLKALGSRRYDLLILDSELPNEDGWDVLKAVRKDPEQKHLKVVVLMAPKGET